MKSLRRHHELMWVFTQNLAANLRRPLFAYLVTLSFSLMAACSVVFYALETGRNPAVRGLFDALYYSVTIMTGVGLGDIAPVTRGGRVLSMAMMLLGTAIFVCFNAVVAAALLEVELQHRERK